MAAFLGSRLPFLGIVDTVEQVVAEHVPVAVASMGVDDVLAAEERARARAREVIAARAARGRA